MQDAVVKGWFRTSRNPVSPGTAHHRIVAMTAFEIASAMSFLHGKGIVHGVSTEFFQLAIYFLFTIHFYSPQQQH